MSDHLVGEVKKKDVLCFLFEKSKDHCTRKIFLHVIGKKYFKKLLGVKTRFTALPSDNDSCIGIGITHVYSLVYRVSASPWSNTSVACP